MTPGVALLAIVSLNADLPPLPDVSSSIDLRIDLRSVQPLRVAKPKRPSRLQEPAVSERVDGWSRVASGDRGSGHWLVPPGWTETVAPDAPPIKPVREEFKLPFGLAVRISASSDCR